MSAFSFDPANQVTAGLTSETVETLQSRSSVRSFLSRPISDDLLATILRASCHAPTSSNIQAYSIIVVRDAATKRELAELAGKQAHVAAAPVFLLICGDLSRAERACRIHGREFVGNTFEMGLVAAVDASLVGMSIMVCAESLGLGCVMIGGVRNHPVQIAHLLHLPPRAFAVFGMCLGWPAERPLQKPRMPDGSVIHFECYDTAKTDRVLAEYDQILNEYYKQRGSGDSESWTERISKEFSRPRRPDLRANLEALGLPFE